MAEPVRTSLESRASKLAQIERINRVVRPGLEFPGNHLAEVRRKRDSLHAEIAGRQARQG